MQQEEKYVPYVQLIETLKRHCIARDSGTLFITTDANEAIRFVLNAGNIISMALRRERGILALDAIRSVVSGRYKFSKESVYSVDGSQQLPSTKELITLLLKNADINGSTRAKVHVEPRNKAIPTSAIPNRVSKQLVNSNRPAMEMKETPSGSNVTLAKETIRKVIEFELIEQMGPVGELICEEHLDTIEENSEKIAIEQMIRNIAIEIDSDAFRQRAMQKLFG